MFRQLQIVDGENRPLVNPARFFHGLLGELSQDEIYFRDKTTGQNTADHYKKMKVSEAVSHMPDEIYYSFSVEVGGQQQNVSQTIPAGSVR